MKKSFSSAAYLVTYFLNPSSARGGEGKRDLDQGVGGGGKPGGEYFVHSTYCEAKRRGTGGGWGSVGVGGDFGDMGDCGGVEGLRFHGRTDGRGW